jgi:NDP-sugar pyrophosphorylase family protein
MAGLGKRFIDFGITTPKPLVNVDGIPMFIRSIQSLKKVDVRFKLIIIIRKGHLQHKHIEKLLDNFGIEGEVRYIDQSTRGAAETAFQATKILDPTSPLMLLDCDIYFESDAFVDKTLKAGNKGFDGSLMYFNSDSKNYSYLELDKLGISVTVTAEKKVISNLAIVGAYYFNEVALFNTFAEKLFLDNLQSGDEYYISKIYSLMITHGKKVSAYKSKMFNFGQPELFT